jgi:hypothetical protein
MNSVATLMTSHNAEGVAQYILYNAPLTDEMVLALPIVMISTALHINYPYRSAAVDAGKAEKKTK